jgi:hypothetical protein
MYNNNINIDNVDGLVNKIIYKNNRDQLLNLFYFTRIYIYF